MSDWGACVGSIPGGGWPASPVGAPPRRDGALGQAPRFIGRRIAARARFPQACRVALDLQSAVGAPPRRDGALGQAQRLIGRRIAARVRLSQSAPILGLAS